MLQRLGHQAGDRVSASTSRGLVVSDSVPRARPGRDREAGETVSWHVNALVEATPISGPASVGATTSLSRAIEEVGTLTTDRTCWPCSLA